MADTENQTQEQQEQNPEPKTFSYDVAAEARKNSVVNRPNPNSPLAAG